MLANRELRATTAARTLGGKDEGSATMPVWLPWARGAAWMALLAAAGVFVHAEALRPELPPGVRAYTDIVYRREAGRRRSLDVYVPLDRAASASVAARPAIVAIHGGGWRGGTKNGYGREVARLARRGYVVVSVEYALSRPGRPTWPENLDDVREAVRWVRRHATDYGIDPNRIAALGASAGGHLAALLGTNAAGIDPEAHVSAVVNFYGPTDLTSLYKSPGAVLPLQLYLGDAPAAVPERYAAASPLSHVSPGDAPTLSIHGESDRLVPLAQSMTLAARLRDAGVVAEVIVVPNVGHAFGLVVNGRDLVPEIVAFLDRVW